MDEQVKHSAEPWEYTGMDDGDFMIWSSNDEDSAFVGNVGAAMQRVGVIIDLDLANARRIVDCVNACEGVDNETLEKIARREMTGSELVELPKVRAQRDELLHALCIALPFVEDCEQDPEYKTGVITRHLKTIRAAIKSAEGAV